MQRCAWQTVLTAYKYDVTTMAGTQALMKLILTASFLCQLERNVGTSRETVEERMRRFPDKALPMSLDHRGVKRLNIDGETQSECWSTDAMVESDAEPGMEYVLGA